MKEIVSFEHFDPKLELGVLDEQGQPIRPRKKPGRKPNPPSPAQRKAQNRAAQRAFRERKRYEMREAQMTAKKCVTAKNQALREIKTLKARIAELEYETNYLKGYSLTLKMACIANRIEVPKFWDAGYTDETGADEISFSKTKGIPQQLEFFLDKDLNIVGFDQLEQNNSQPEHHPSSIEQKASEFIELGDILSPPFPSPSLTSLFPSDFPEDQESVFNHEDEERVIDPKTGIIRVTTECPPDDNHSVHSQKSQESKKIFPPMSSYEAIQVFRSIKHLDENTRVLFTPTELQRTVRHDPRIDAIPGPVYRDHMILFQDYYNANELFEYLINNSVFLGGELGNLDNWFVPPYFFKKYWFFTPTYRRQRVDNAVEMMAHLNQKMIELLTRRKVMYLERDQYPDHFPTPSKEEQQVIDHEFLETDDQDLLSDLLEEEKKIIEEEDHSMKENEIIQPLKLIPSHCPLSKYQQTIQLY